MYSLEKLQAQSVTDAGGSKSNEESRQNVPTENSPSSAEQEVNKQPVDIADNTIDKPGDSAEINSDRCQNESVGIGEQSQNLKTPENENSSASSPRKPNRNGKHEI